MNPEHLQKLCFDFALGTPQEIHEDTEGVLNTNYFLKSDTGSFFIKSVREKKKDTIRYIAAVEQYMANQNIPAVCMLLNSLGEPYIQYGTHVYTIYPFVQNERIEPFTPEDMYIMGSMLGHIHRAGSRDVPEFLRSQVMKYKTEDDVLKILNIHKTNILDKENQSDIDTLFLSYIELKLRVLPSIEKLSLPNNTLVHGDYHARNLLFGANREIVGICDWEKAEVAPRAYELARSIHCICFDDSENPEGYGRDTAIENSRSFLRGYLEAFPITREEIIQGFQIRLHRLVNSTWIEEQYYGQGDARGNKFIRLEMQRIEDFSGNAILEEMLT